MPLLPEVLPAILIVDDEERSRVAIEGALSHQGYLLNFAHNGQEGLLMASHMLPDLILLDVMMPEMDGFEVCRCLRADPPLAEVPILMITALDDQDSRLQGLEAGADDFITKPFNRAELRARVHTIIRLNRYRKLVNERSQMEEVLHQLEEAYDATIGGWGRALELRDHETEGHSQRVTNMALRLGRELKLDHEAQLHLFRGAVLHDIGKMGIPDSILLKPGPLTEEEKNIMRQHPVLAYRLLSPIRFLEQALVVPYCHHEWWNGAGYPRGLKGEAIPLAARLFAAIDVWDALSYERPYRQAWPQERVLEYLRTQSGTQFDAHIVEVFLGLLEEDRVEAAAHPAPADPPPDPSGDIKTPTG